MFRTSPAPALPPPHVVRFASACRAGFEELSRQIEYVMPLEQQPQQQRAAGVVPPPGLAALPSIVAARRPPGAEVSWWAEEVGTTMTSSSTDASCPHPVASAIKTFLLVALYYEHRAALDSVPPELQAILAQEPGWEPVLAMWDPLRPEWEAYRVPAGTLEEVQRTLGGWTYRMLAQGMMGTTSMAVIGNSAYNTCANVRCLISV